jgi:putative DNA primase/helicase
MPQHTTDPDYHDLPKLPVSHGNGSVDGELGRPDSRTTGAMAAARLRAEVVMSLRFQDLNLADLRRQTAKRWPGILKSLAGLTDSQLRNRHQPCPACGGRDRYRYHDREDFGNFFCNGCGAGDGFALLQRVNNWEFKRAAVEVAEFLRVGSTTTPPERPQMPQEARRPASRTAHLATSIWPRADRRDSAVASHPYAIRKGIRHAAGAGRARVPGTFSIVGTDADLLVIPSRDFDSGELVGVELINAEGAKQTLGNRGVLVLGNDLDETLPVFVIEGWASAAVAVFGDAFFRGNACAIVAGGKARLDKVAELVAAKYPNRTVTIWRESDAHH